MIAVLLSHVTEHKAFLPIEPSLYLDDIIFFAKKKSRNSIRHIKVIKRLLFKNNSIILRIYFKTNLSGLLSFKSYN